MPLNRRGRIANSVHLGKPNHHERKSYCLDTRYHGDGGDIGKGRQRRGGMCQTAGAICCDRGRRVAHTSPDSRVARPVTTVGLSREIHHPPASVDLSPTIGSSGVTH